MLTAQRSQHAKNVVDTLKNPINDLYMEVYNTIYDELTKESIDSFNDGWVEAVAYMKSHTDCTIEELHKAKIEEMQKRYSYTYVL